MADENEAEIAALVETPKKRAKPEPSIDKAPSFEKSRKKSKAEESIVAGTAAVEDLDGYKLEQQKKDGVDFWAIFPDDVICIDLQEVSQTV